MMCLKQTPEESHIYWSLSKFTLFTFAYCTYYLKTVVTLIKGQNVGVLKKDKVQAKISIKKIQCLNALIVISIVPKKDF